MFESLKARYAQKKAPIVCYGHDANGKPVLISYGAASEAAAIAQAKVLAPLGLPWSRVSQCVEV